MSDFLSVLQQRGPMTLNEIRATMQVEIATMNGFIAEATKAGSIYAPSSSYLMQCTAVLWELATHSVDFSEPPPRTAAAEPEAPLTACPVSRRP